MTNKPQIAIIGGGIAGICAALGAAESGAAVTLVEKSGSLGGNATRTNVGTICGAYTRSLNNNAVLVGPAFSQNLITGLLKRLGMDGPVNYHNGLHIIPYEWTALQEYLEDQLAAKKNIKVLVGAELESVAIDRGKIRNLILRRNDEKINVLTHSVVDCSGNSIVSQLTGLETLSSRQYQAAAQVFRVSGVNASSEFSMNMAIKRAMAELIPKLNWPASFNALSVVPGSLRNGQADIKLSLPEVITDNTEKITDLNLRAKLYIDNLFPQLSAQVESLSKAKISQIFPEAGVRVLQRARGKHTLGEEEVRQCAKPGTGVAVGAWPIEYWKTDGTVEMVYLTPEESYLIPAECLISDQLENLFFAGKNISATDRAIASARVIGTCIQTGYAAGRFSTCTSAAELEKTVMELHKELVT